MCWGRIYQNIIYYKIICLNTLTILSHYKTYQQTTEITCGPAAALTVLVHFGNTNWTEKEIAKIMDTKPAVGADIKGMVEFFKPIGWDVTSSLSSVDKNGTTFATVDYSQDGYNVNSVERFYYM